MKFYFYINFAYLLLVFIFIFHISYYNSLLKMLCTLWFAWIFIAKRDTTKKLGSCKIIQKHILKEWMHKSSYYEHQYAARQVIKQNSSTRNKHYIIFINRNKKKKKEKRENKHIQTHSLTNTYTKKTNSNNMQERKYFKIWNYSFFF